MKIRRASAGDMAAVMRLVDCVFTQEQQIPKDLNPIAERQCPQWWCIEHDGEIAGTAALFRENENWHVGRLAISAPLRGQHMGTALLRYMMRDVFAHDVETVYLEARDTTVHIMKKLGAKTVGEPVLFYGGRITPMVLQKKDFLEQEEG